MGRDRDREVAHHLRAADVQRHLRARHVRDRHVRDRRQRVRETRAAVHRCQSGHQPRRAERREVGRDGRLEVAHQRLGRGRRLVDHAEALERIREVRGERHHRHRDLVVRVGVALLAQRHRHGRGQRLLRQHVVLAQVTTQRATAGREHDVVERVAETLADLLRLGKRDGATRVSALIRDRHVEQRLRAQQLHRPGRLEVALADRVIARRRLRHHDALQRARHVGEGLHELDVLLQRVADGRRCELDHPELIAMQALPFARRLHLARLGRDVHDRGRERDAGLAIDAGVMHLRIQRDTSTTSGPGFQPVDHEELPQRPAAVEQRRVQPCNVLLQLSMRARLRQRDPTDVIVDVDLVVLDPHRIRQLERHQRELAREHGRDVQAIDDVLLEVLVEVAGVAVGQFQRVQAADVHRRLRGLEMQEARIHAAQMVHALSPRVASRVMAGAGFPAPIEECFRSVVRRVRRVVDRGNIAADGATATRVCPRRRGSSVRSVQRV